MFETMREAQRWLQQCERHRGGCSRQRQRREHRIAVEVALTSGGFPTEKDVKIWVDQLLLGNLVSMQQSGSAMGSMLRGHRSTDAAAAVAMSWTIVQEAVVQWLLGTRPSISIGTVCRRINVMFSGGALLEHIPH